jgi:D-glycero-alpha-D-manno-heptose 1-phosphate guanylyltransferase
MIRLLVLAGGFGTRLKPAIADTPKALAPIGSVPFLRLQLEHWVAQGLCEFTFLLHYKANRIIDLLQVLQGELLRSCKVDCVIEPVPLGTGGAVAHAVKTLNLKGDFLITNADTWLGGGFHEVRNSASPAIAVLNLRDVSRYGQVDFDHAQRVKNFAEKNGQSAPGWINAGLYHLAADMVKDWDGQPFSLERDLFPRSVQDGRLTAVPLEATFIDIGIPDDYHRFCRWVAAGRKEPLCS